MIDQAGEDVLLRVKAVPGASRDAIAGPLGDRLKVRVSAPAEGGKANRAICALLARAVGIRPGGVSVESGAGGPEKVVRLRGVSATLVRSRLGGPPAGG
jgi:hypothetical protein